MPEIPILIVLLLSLSLGVRATWVWTLRGRNQVSPWRGTAGALAISLVLLNCFYFISRFCKGEIGGFGTHYVTTRMIGWYLLGSIATTSSVWFLKSESRWEALIAGLLVTALWFGAGLVA